MTELRKKRARAALPPSSASPHHAVKECAPLFSVDPRLIGEPLPASYEVEPTLVWENIPAASLSTQFLPARLFRQLAQREKSLWVAR